MSHLLRRIALIFCLAATFTFMHVSPARGDTPPDSTYISGVNGHAQSFPLSCESRSAVDVTAFWGVRIGEAEFLNSLPRADNPDEGFVGDPGETWGRVPPYGYGVHAGPVAKALQEFGLHAEAQHGISWDDLREEIQLNHPVIVWVIGQMWNGIPMEYEAPDGSSSTVAAYEHTMILTGYSPDAIQVVDAYTGNIQRYGISTFLKSWAVLGNMAVFVSDGASRGDEPASSETHAEAYTVQAGDYLVALADRFETTWQELAELNSIGYPYTIFAGQVLKLPERQDQEAEAQPEASPAPVETPPAVKVINFQARLPMVQSNASSQSIPPVAISSVLPGPGRIIVVQSPDTLLRFSKSIGADWHMLAELNNLHPPFHLQPGQVLKVR